MMRPWVFLGLVGAAALSGCGPEDRSGSVQAEVVAVVGPASEHGLTVETVDRLESLVALRGRDVELRAGAVIRQGANAELSGDPGGPFQLGYQLDAAGVVRTTDLSSLSALSLYRHLDVSAEALRQLGYQPSRRLHVYHFPSVDSAILGDMRALFMDNAGYAARFHAYFVMPSLFLKELPLSMNLGVVAHEYGHAVQQQLILKDSLENHADHLAFASSNEGVADLFGFVVSADPAFMAPSAPVDRDLSKPQSYTDADATELAKGKAADGSAADPHRHGSLMARAVYEAWPKQTLGTFTAAERAAFGRAILKTLGQLEFNESFSLVTFPDALLAEVPAASLPSACKVLQKRLAPLYGSIAHCRGVGP